ncbi:hypothetical protein BD410DRAFT_489208 [Rickenella mellea]|uniref:Uncharacterized protein n=1 Tax=Rickenella mellea TaxID=50990 RepID=A0A4Y7PVS6_9AGAM|nr:hypothetical protein BD410DRAFT_489208 [Rickenella mellea]
MEKLRGTISSYPQFTIGCTQTNILTATSCGLLSNHQTYHMAHLGLNTSQSALAPSTFLASTKLSTLLVGRAHSPIDGTKVTVNKQMFSELSLLTLLHSVTSRRRDALRTLSHTRNNTGTVSARNYI